MMPIWHQDLEPSSPPAVQRTHSEKNGWKRDCVGVVVSLENFTFEMHIMFTPARDFLLETPWRIIIPNPNVNSHSL
jgi:hypothetical protein